MAKDTKAATTTTEPNPNPLQPTPPIGWPVQYFLPGEDPGEEYGSQPIAATVVNVEAPGRLELRVCKPNGQWERKVGVYHRSHEPFASGKLRNMHTWQFIPGLTPKNVYAFAQQQRDKAQRQQEQAELDRLAIEERERRRREGLLKLQEMDPVIPQPR